jgi:glutamate-ammonia-ligase adenylyltransferase
MTLDPQLLDIVCAKTRGLEPGQVEGFLGRLEGEYFEQFDAATIARHVRALASLSGENPVVVLLDKDNDKDNDKDKDKDKDKEGVIDCTVVAFDHPFEFSCITGVMAATGFNILSSDAFTLRPAKGEKPRKGVRNRKTAISAGDPARHAVILDHFKGKLNGAKADFGSWEKAFVPLIDQIMRLLDDEDDKATDRAKRLVNERVTEWLRWRRGKPGPPDLVSLDISIEQLAEFTRLRLWAPDAPAFLYALSTALSLHSLQIERTRARAVGGLNIDEIDLVDSHGKAISDPERIEQLRGSVLLTQQFVYFLDRAPDPFSALQRFEELAEKIVQSEQRQQWLELLEDPRSMTDLAKVLGASDYLWEDFIRWQSDKLLETFERHARGRQLMMPEGSLPRRLEEAIGGARHFEDQRQRLNEFKDHELFLIDLDHILTEANPDSAFEDLSERLVFLAENLVATACRLVFMELKRLYGQPQDAKKHPVNYAIFGLGKLGGVALGYASDIELLFLYDGDGSTSGGIRGSLDNGEFFAIFTRESSAYIQAKREGIFQVDLRLRPFGSSGPLACSKREFAAYYDPKGKAHPFERLALARLRWIAGDTQVGFAIEQLRDRILYDSGKMDFEAVWEISEKMRAQHGKLGTMNSKQSPGALADLEQVVQMLQVMHAKEAPQLRTPRLHEAMGALRRAEILSAVEFEQLSGAYRFLRRLINAQRMLRGSARDLFLPARESAELLPLARRMNYRGESEDADVGEMLLGDFGRHTRVVRKFIKSGFWRGAK